MSSHPRMVKVRQVSRALVFIGLLFLFVSVYGSAAYGQSFTLSIAGNGLQPAAVDPGGFATSGLNLTANGGFNSVVTLSCAVTGGQTPLPTCYVSPSTATPNAAVSLTVLTSGTAGSAPAGEYTITVTGTSGSETETVTLFLNVVDVEQDYTLTVSTPINPSTVTAGSGATATITVTPTTGYTGTVTLSCLSVTPVVTAAPICSFQSAADGSPSVPILNGSAATATLTIGTFGTTQHTAQAWRTRTFYALWLGLPGLALVGVGVGGKHRRRLLGFCLLLGVAAGLVMLPACNTSSSTSNNSGGLVTPKDTYTFTLTGVDQAGIGPSNGTTGQATVSLTVN